MATQTSHKLENFHDINPIDRLNADDYNFIADVENYEDKIDDDLDRANREKFTN